MASTSSFNRTYLTVSVVAVLVGLFGYLTFTNQWQNLFSGRFLLSQVTPVTQVDLDYLKALNGLASLDDVTSFEELRQRFIETLLIHAQEFDAASATSAENYLKDYYEFTQPVPASIQGTVTTAVASFQQVRLLIPTTTTVSITPFLNEVLTILANHQVATNNHQAAARSRAARSLLDSLIKQL